MAFAISRHKLPTLRSFHACDNHANKMRSKLHSRANKVWGPSCLPLVAMRDLDKRLEWREKTQAWACVYHNSSVVTYYKDGRVLLNASWDSVSTRLFFEEMSPEGVWLYKTKYGLAYCIGHAENRWQPATYDKDVEWHEVNRNIDHENDVGQGLLIDVIDEFGTVLNPQPWTTTRRVSNKEMRKEIRTKLGAFTTWFDAMTRVGNSMKGVVAAVEKFDESHSWAMRPMTKYGAIESMLDEMINGDVFDNTQAWQEACWSALVSVGGSYYWSKERFEQEKYNIDMAACVKKHILDKAFELHDGWKLVTTAVPAGKKP